MRNTAQGLPAGHPMVYHFLVIRPGATLRHARHIHVAAQTEAEARATLGHLPLVFAGRFPVGGFAA